jgi:hypothetical protein
VAGGGGLTVFVGPVNYNRNVIMNDPVKRSGVYRESRRLVVIGRFRCLTINRAGERLSCRQPQVVHVSP